MRAAVLTPAKLNWDLRVLGRRADGFHELRSWFFAVDWCDQLTVQAQGGGDSSLLEITGPQAADVPDDARNLVLRAELAWRAAFPERAARLPALHWKLRKDIPHGAGLGGGSGNAAGALCLLEHWVGPPGADAQQLLRLAMSLGSDVPFFLQAQGLAELRGGRGELRLASAPAPVAACVIAVPPFTISTAAVYGALDAREDTTASRLRSDPSAHPAATPGPNDLTPAAQKVEPKLRDWLRQVQDLAALTMSGSGSAHFAPAPSLAAAQDLAVRLAPLCRTVWAGRPRLGPLLPTRME